MSNKILDDKYYTNKDSTSLLKLRNNLAKYIIQSNLDPEIKTQKLKLLYERHTSELPDNSDHHDINEITIDNYLIVLVMSNQKRYYLYEDDLKSTNISPDRIAEYCIINNINVDNVEVIIISKYVTEIQSHAFDIFLNIEGILFDNNENIKLNENIITLTESIHYIKLPKNIDENGQKSIFGYSANSELTQH